jgi:hypothetical protein
MKLQDVMLRAMAKRITCFQAAEILGSCRQMQRWHTGGSTKKGTHKWYDTVFGSGSIRPKPGKNPDHASKIARWFGPATRDRSLW